MKNVVVAISVFFCYKQSRNGSNFNIIFNDFLKNFLKQRDVPDSQIPS